MLLLSKFRELRRQERAAVAVITTVFLTAIVGVTGAAVDMGRVYSSYTELQNAADAAAKAGADTMISWDADNNATTQCDTATATAKAYSITNEAMGTNLVLLDDDITMGAWDFELEDFDPTRTGPTGNPDDLNAFRVTIRRDGDANSPLTTVFAGILGLSEISLAATSTAYLGYAGSTQAGQVDLPIAVLADSLGGGDNPNCGETIQFSSENNENGEWTTFFSFPSNDPQVRKYIEGSEEIPGLKVGDEIAVTNGNLSNPTFDQLEARFQIEGIDTDGDGGADEWEVLLPVVDSGGEASSSTIVGFAHMMITDVLGAPAKTIFGHLSCEMVVPESETGGGDFGSRATFSKTIQ